MARSETAQILIQIRGGMKAAAEATAAARGVEDLDDELTDAERSALKASAALEVFERQLKKVTRASAASAAMTSLNTLALRGLLVVAVGLAITALPALGSALASLTLVTVAFLGALVGVTAGLGLMGVGAVMRFKETADAAWSAAGAMKAAAGELKSTFSAATAAGSDKIFEGITGGLKEITPLIQSLTPEFTAIGGAIGDTIGRFFHEIKTMGPELKSMLGQLPDAVGPLGDIFTHVLGLIIRVTDVAMPMLIGGLEWLDDKVVAFTDGFTDGKLNSALSTVKTMFEGIGAVIGGFADALGPVIGPAAADMASTFAGAGHEIGAALGLIVAGIVQISQGGLPGIVEGIQALAPAFQQIVDSGALATLGHVLGDVFSTAAGTLADIVDYLDRTGKLKGTILGLAGAFVGVKAAIIAARVATKAWSIATGIADVATGAWAAATRGLAAAQSGYQTVALLSMYAVDGLRNANILLRIQLGLLAVQSAVATAAMAAFNFVMALNPIVLVIAALVALGIGFVVAYKKISWFRDGVNAVWSWIKGHWPLLLAILTGPIGLAVKFIVDHFDQIVTVAKAVPGKITAAMSGMWDGLKKGFTAALNWIIGKLNWFIDKYNAVGGLLRKLPGVPDLTLDPIGPIGDDRPKPGDGAFVGPVRPSSPAAPAKRRGASAKPRASLRGALSNVLPPFEVNIPLSIDGREVATAVGNTNLRERARNR